MRSDIENVSRRIFCVFCATLMGALAMPQLALAQERVFPDKSVLVIATPGYAWAASDVSKVLGVRATPTDLGMVEAADLALSDPHLVGVVEVEINVAQFYETVYAICRDKQGQEVWREKRMLNFGGGAGALGEGYGGGASEEGERKEVPAMRNNLHAGRDAFQSNNVRSFKQERPSRAGSPGNVFIPWAARSAPR